MLRSALFATCCSMLFWASAVADELPAPTGEGIVASDARLEHLFTRRSDLQGGLTEGPAAAPDGSIYFSDIPFGPGGMILRFDPVTETTAVFTFDSGKSNGLVFDSQGRMIACEGANDGGRRLSRWNVHTGERETLTDSYQAKRYNSPNDVCLDAAGRVYFTDPRYVGPESRELERQAVYRVDPDGSVHEVTHDVNKPNGVALSPDGRTLYVAEHDNGTDNIDPDAPPPPQGAMRIYGFPLNERGEVSGKRRTVYEFGDFKGCDGMTLDEHGNLYLTQRDARRPGVLVINPEGTEIAFIPTGPADQSSRDPQNPPRGLPSNVEFGIGDQSHVLYITVDTSLYRIPLKVGGHRPGNKSL